MPIPAAAVPSPLAPPPPPCDAAAETLAVMFGVDADAAQVALQCSGGDFAAAGQLLCQQQQREARKAVQQARDEEREAAQAAKHAERKAAREAMECVVCMDAPKTHSFTPCGHHCACKGCAENVMRRDKKCPYCRMQADSIQRIFG